MSAEIRGKWACTKCKCVSYQPIDVQKKTQLKCGCACPGWLRFDKFVKVTRPQDRAMPA